MTNYVAYHKVNEWGEYPECTTVFRHFSRKPLSILQSTIGNRVWVISGRSVHGRTMFHLCATFIVDAVTPHGKMHAVEGPGTSFVPQVPLNGRDWFDELKTEQANFSLGLSTIRSNLVTTALLELESQNTVVTQSSSGSKKRRALSIRQPHAEAIMRGTKKIEFRSRPTKIRGTIHIYASLGRYPPNEESRMMLEYGISDAECDDLPRGVIVGTVELFDCDGGNWHVRNPIRAKRLKKPTRHPQPVWFYPFN